MYVRLPTCSVESFMVLNIQLWRVAERVSLDVTSRIVFVASPSKVLLV